MIQEMALSLTYNKENGFAICIKAQINVTIAEIHKTILHYWTTHIHNVHHRQYCNNKYIIAFFFICFLYNAINFEFTALHYHGNYLKKLFPLILSVIDVEVSDHAVTSLHAPYVM